MTKVNESKMRTRNWGERKNDGDKYMKHIVYEANDNDNAKLIWKWENASIEFVVAAHSLYKFDAESGKSSHLSMLANDGNVAYGARVYVRASNSVNTIMRHLKIENCKRTHSIRFLHIFWL